jgi:recombination protein RecA
MSRAAELVKQANALFGDGAVKLGSDDYYKTSFLPTGVFPIDHLLGGGIPRGRFTEFYGNFSTLKSLVALNCIARTQQNGGVCVLIDTEHSFDPDWALSVGVAVDELILQQPDTGEEAIDLTEAFIRAGVDLVVWDSVAATLPKAEANVQMGGDKSAQPARLAALMSAGLRKLNTANKNHTAILCINQVREMYKNQNNNN